MSKLVDRVMTQYQTDFTKHDKAIIAEHPGDRFIWILHPWHTHYICLDKPDKYDITLMEYYLKPINAGDNQFYSANPKTGSLTKINKGTAENHLCDMKAKSRSRRSYSQLVVA